MANCANDRCGIEALQDIDGFYRPSGQQSGYLGRLWGGSNRATDQYVQAGRELGQQIATSAGGGAGGSSPVIFAALGFSYTKRAFDAMASQAATDARVNNAGVDFVDLAFVGVDAVRMADPSDNYWILRVPELLAEAQITAAEVKVAYILTGNRTQVEAFPQHVETLRGQLQQILAICKSTFPNLRMAFFTPMQYQGYKDSPVLPPPEAYVAEQQLAFQEFLRDQQVAFLEPGATGSATVWCGWAEPAWCDGARSRGDGFLWTCPTDVDPDGAHQSATGKAKMGARLLEALLGDPSSMPWLRAGGDSAACGRQGIAYRFGESGHGGEDDLTLFVDRRPTIDEDTNPPGSSVALMVSGCRPGAPVTFALGTKKVDVPFAGGHLYVGDEPGAPAAYFTAVADGAGVAMVEVASSVPHELGGADWFAQAWAWDSVLHRLVLSRGLAIEVGD